MLIKRRIRRIISNCKLHRVSYIKTHASDSDADADGSWHSYAMPGTCTHTHTGGGAAEKKRWRRCVGTGTGAAIAVAGQCKFTPARARVTKGDVRWCENFGKRRTSGVQRLRLAHLGAWCLAWVRTNRAICRRCVLAGSSQPAVL